MFTHMLYEAPVKKGKKSKAAVKKEQTKLHNHIKKDLGNKKPTSSTSPSADDGIVGYSSQWYMKDVDIFADTYYKSKKTTQTIFVRFYF